jgi:hypothetical protein
LTIELSGERQLFFIQRRNPAASSDHGMGGGEVDFDLESDGQLQTTIISTERKYNHFDSVILF